MEEALYVDNLFKLIQVLEEHTEKSVIVYFFNDLVLVTEKDKFFNTLLWKIIEIDEFSICKNVPD